RPQEGRASPVNFLHERNQRRTGDNCPCRRRRKEPAVSARSDMKDVLREDRQQGGRRRKERRKKIDQHRRSDQRGSEDEVQPFERSAQRYGILRAEWM